MNKKKEFNLNIVLLGDSGVEKSKYMNSFLNNKIEDIEESLIGIKIEEKTIQINFKQKGIVNLIDTSGQEKFKRIMNNIYERGDGFIIFSSFLNKESIKSISDWYNNIIEYKSKDVPIKHIIIDGDKVDTETKESIINEIIEYFISLNNPDLPCLGFEECNYNIEEINHCFTQFIIEILDFQKLNQMKKKEESINSG